MVLDYSWFDASKGEYAIEVVGEPPLPGVVDRELAKAWDQILLIVGDSSRLLYENLLWGDDFFPAQKCELLKREYAVCGFGKLHHINADQTNLPPMRKKLLLTKSKTLDILKTVMTEAPLETVQVSESTEKRIRDYFSLLQDRFSGQQPVVHEVNRAIQPRVEPDPASLPSIKEMLSEFANAGDWQEMPHNMGYVSSGEPVGEQPEWRKDYLHLNLPPNAESGDTWARMVLHRGRRGEEGKPVAIEPYAMLSYFPAGKAEDGSKTSPARIEVVFFSRWDSSTQKELASVARLYEEKP